MNFKWSLLFDWTKALCRHLSPLFFAIWSPDSLARISLYNPSAVKVVVVRSGISRRQNTSRHRSSYVTSTLSCKESRQRDGGRLWFTFIAHINILSWWEIKKEEQLRCVRKQTIISLQDDRSTANMYFRFKLCKSHYFSKIPVQPIHMLRDYCRLSMDYQHTLLLDCDSWQDYYSQDGHKCQQYFPWKSF